MLSLRSDQILSEKFTLNNSHLIPAVGFCTLRMRSSDTVMNMVDSALAAGYRMFDTSSMYGNETNLGIALNTLLPKYDLEREDIFITTKLSPSDQGGGHVTERAFEKSLNHLMTDYIDLYLINYSGNAKTSLEKAKSNGMRIKTWSTLKKLYDEGRVNAIGVSNYDVSYLRDVMDCSRGVIPAVNQVEWNPFYYQKNVTEYCKENDILIQAYCSLEDTSTADYKLLNDLKVKAIAKRLEVTPSQLLLKWAVQQGIAIIPMATHPHSLKDNICLNFDIPTSDLNMLTTTLNKKINKVGKHLK